MRACEWARVDVSVLERVFLYVGVCTSVCARVCVWAIAPVVAPPSVRFPPPTPPPLPLALREGGVVGVEGGPAPKWGGASPLRSAGGEGEGAWGRQRSTGGRALRWLRWVRHRVVVSAWVSLDACVCVCVRGLYVRVCVCACVRACVCLCMRV